MLTLAPCTVKAAKLWVKANHSRLPDLHAALGAVAVEQNGERVCVAVIGQPVAPAFQHRRIAEIVRVASNGAAEHACSMAYGAARRLALAGAYRRIVTYTHLDEKGTALRAAGFWPVELTSGGQRDRTNRRRKPVVDSAPKIRWEAGPDALPINREVAAMVPGWSSERKIA